MFSFENYFISLVEHRRAERPKCCRCMLASALFAILLLSHIGTNVVAAQDIGNTPSPLGGGGGVVVVHSPSNSSNDQTVTSSPINVVGGQAIVYSPSSIGTNEATMSTSSGTRSDEAVTFSPSGGSGNDYKAIAYNPSGTSGDEVVASSHSDTGDDEAGTFSPSSTGGDEAVTFSPSSTDGDEDGAPTSSNGVSKASKVLIKLICKYTNYEELCMESLNRVAEETTTTKDIVRATINVVVEAINEGFQHSDKTTIDNESIKGAMEVCRTVHANIVYDLNKTLATINMHNIEDLSEHVDDLNTWLSAAIAYQETCIDSYPEGKMRHRMRMLLESGTHLADNALAILDNLSKFIGGLSPSASTALHSFLDFISGNRRFLRGEDGVEGHHLPSWIHENERRVILEDPTFDFVPNAIVAKDGSGDFKTISKALKHVPQESMDRYVIYIKEGVYKEHTTITIPKNMWNITMYGDGPSKTVITGRKNFIDGVKTFFTATVDVCGEGFMAVGIGFENTAGPKKHQAVALLVRADRANFVNCRMSGYQDTLYPHSGRQFYYSCEISGTVDFIFGDSRSIFQRCTVIVRKGLPHQKNTVFAQGRRTKNERTALVLQKCKIIAEPELAAVISEYKCYLGRPWKLYSRNVIIESDIGDLIHPDGYMPMRGKFALRTLTYLEFGNTGKGADTSKRVSWSGVKSITAKEAKKWTVEPFFGASEWITSTGTPFHIGLYSTSN